MASPIPVTLIFDIGRTNKKLLLFDENYEIIHQEQAVLDQSEDDEGYPCENLDLLTDWVKQKFSAVLRNKRFKITSMNFSAYGASLVHLGDKGQTVGRLYNYLKPYPEDLLQEFYELNRGRENFSVETASPPLGMLNSGLQLYWLKKKKPLLFREIRHTLHLPQYISHLLTNEYTSEITSVGCHTGMWDYKENKYHPWLVQEECLKLLPDIQSNFAIKKIVFDQVSIKTGPGIHDSSAALAPYLYTFDEQFMLVSTGTWSITFNPFNKDPLLFKELRRDCLCYLSIHGDQVKASRLFLGSEYAHQKRKLNQHFNGNGEEVNGHDDIEPDPVILKKLIDENNPAKKLQLETAYNSGPCPGDEPGEWKPGLFSSYEEACHQLMLDLVAIQAESIKLAEGSVKIDKLIITGGFSQNKLFVKLLASRFPDKKVYTASLSEASALGAALVINGEHKDPASLKELLNFRQHTPINNAGIERYKWRQSQ